MMYILFISYLATIVVHSRNFSEHIGNLALVSFIGLFIVVIIVLIVISEGDGLDGIDFGTGSGDGYNYKNTKRNPYDFM